MILRLKVASAGVVRLYPAEAFAKGGNSDELQVVPWSHLLPNHNLDAVLELLLKITFSP